MLIEGIKSRPIYTGLKPDPYARRNLVAAQGDGLAAATGMLGLADGNFAARTTFLVTEEGLSSPAPALPEIDQLLRCPTEAALLAQLDELLATATMGTRLYAAGSEGFIGRVVQCAIAHGIDAQSVLTEHRGTAARRVQCVHCKGFTEHVTTNIVPCAHCGANLLVRDHYSRRLAAFQGVAVDAEAPGILPPIREIFR